MLNLLSSFKILLLFSFLVRFIETSSDTELSFTITIEESGVQKDLIEFIKDGQQNGTMMTQKKKAIMVLGLTGTGKSTLVNYLNNVPLVCKRVGGKWIVDLLLPDSSLPGGFAIGHTVSSKTLYPAVYSPDGKDFAYIDNPGFKDTRAIAIEIANSFFREQVTREVTELKFLLLVTHQDLNSRAQQFRDSIKSFSSFLGIFDSNENAKDLSKSIGIVVTRVENDGDTDSEMLSVLKTKLFETLDDEKRSKQLTKNEEIVFRNIIEKNQVEIFSNPKKSINLTNEQSIKILSLINKLSYVKKTDAKIRARIDNSYIPQLLVYLKKKFENFTNNIEAVLKNATSEYFEYKKSSLRFANDSAFVYKVLKELQKNGLEHKTFDKFINMIDSSVLDNSKRDSIQFAKTVINFFIQLLPNEQTEEYTKVRKWIGFDLNSHLIVLMDLLVEHLKSEFIKLEILVDNILLKYISKFFSKEVNRLEQIEDIKNVETKLDYFHFNCSKPMNFEYFLDCIDDTILNKTEKSELNELVLSESFPILTFVNLLPEEKKNEFPDVKDWIGKFLVSKLNELKVELKNFKIERDQNQLDDMGNEFTYEGYFVKMSSVLSKINLNQQIKNLRSVNIYSTHSFIFDTNYTLDKTSYIDHSPDLVIITPIVIVNNPITVDLSCKNVPGFPNNVIKVNQGMNGSPGLYGFDGGNLIILAEEITNIGNLNFLSKGGQGGPGQAGKIHKDYSFSICQNIFFLNRRRWY